jgi:hypothetical protein
MSSVEFCTGGCENRTWCVSWRITTVGSRCQGTPSEHMAGWKKAPLLLRSDSAGYPWKHSLRHSLPLSHLGCRSGNKLDLYSEGSSFEPWSRHLLSWQSCVIVFPQSLQANTGIVSGLGNNSFLPNPFNSSFSSSIHSTLYSLAIDIVVKYLTRNGPVKGREF